MYPTYNFRKNKIGDMNDSVWGQFDVEATKILIPACMTIDIENGLYEPTEISLSQNVLQVYSSILNFNIPSFTLNMFKD